MITPEKTAFLFPGQASQVVGMGKDFAETYPVARAVFAQADAILGLPFSHMMFEGPEAELDDTYNTQPAVYICSVAILRVLWQERPLFVPAGAAGHSLGELTALTAAGALTFEDGLPLVRERARLMRAAGEQHSGAMAAILGAELSDVEKLCAAAAEKTSKPLVIANDNCPGQIAISGDSAALDAALEMAKEFGIKKYIRLPVSVATHSPLMAPAEADFTKRVQATAFSLPAFPVYANVSVQPLTTVDAIRTELEMQLTRPVRWREIIEAMIANGVEMFIEVGSKTVLTGLMRRIDKEKTTVNLDSVAAFSAFLQQNT